MKRKDDNMKAHTEYLWFNTRKQKEFINITETVEGIVKKSEVKEGFVLVSAMHITASVFVNDEEDGIKQDLLEWAERLAPFRKDYLHHQNEHHLCRQILFRPQ